MPKPSPPTHIHPRSLDRPTPSTPDAPNLFRGGTAGASGERTQPVGAGSRMDAVFCGLGSKDVMQTKTGDGCAMIEVRLE